MKHQRAKAKRFTKPAVAALLALAVAGTGIATAGFGTFSANAEGTEKAGFFTEDFESYAAEQEAAGEFNIELAKESYVLMKNANAALPLVKGIENRVSVFGTRSDNIILGGSGSGGGSAPNAATVKQSLEAAGFVVNPKLVEIYAATTATAELPVSDLAPAAGTYRFYNDAAIIIISRTGSEFNDAALWNVAGHSDPLDHTYSLDDNEKDLIMLAKKNFDKVVVVVNSAHPVELGDLDDEKTEDNLGVDAILWMGHPGKTGAMALGAILNGDVNPSGHTSDVYGRDFTKDPTWANFKGNIQSQLVSDYEMVKDGSTWKYVEDKDHNKTPCAYIAPFYTPEQLNADTTGKLENTVAPADSVSSTNEAYMKYARVTDMDGNPVTVDGPARDARYYAVLDYEEGIYMGYRWYETAYADIAAGKYTYTDGELAKAATAPANAQAQADAWYKDNVVYPFGYGLSYSTFEWEITEPTLTVTDSTKEVTITVKVTNTGDVAGKDVGEIYVKAPYTGKIEKAEVALVDFVKSGILEPKASQTFTVKINPQDLASYDVTREHDSVKGAYVLEQGNYELGVYTDSHTKADSATFSVASDIVYKTDSTTGATIKNRFTSGAEEWYGTRKEDSAYWDSVRGDWISPKSPMVEMSRDDFVGTFPKAPTADDLKFSDEAIQVLMNTTYYTGFNDLPSDPWYVAEAPEDWTQASADDVKKREDGKTEIQLNDMAGVDFDDDKWVEFMNQLTYAEMVSLISSTRFATSALAAIGKIAEQDADGPAQFSSGTFWVCEVNIASTWNTDMAYQQGVFVGNESLFLDVEGWYGPGLNTHRNPTAGRNFEYYSQDGVHGGKIAAAVIKGAVSKGVKVYMKHLFLNDQETSRYVASTFVTEQAIREIYIKPFELAIKAGGANAYMRGFNRVGLHSNDAHYTLNVGLLAEEFGFYGQSVSDMFGWSYSPSGSGDMGARINGTPLGTWVASFGRNIEGEWDEEENNVKLTFTQDITNGTKWPSAWATSGTAMNAQNPGDINTINNGYSAAYYVTTGEGANAKNVPVNTLLKDDLPEGAKLYAKGDTIYSATQWAAVRNTAQRLLYVAANSNTQKNGLAISFAAKTLNVSAGARESIATGVKGATYTVASLPNGFVGSVGLDGTITVDPTCPAGRYTLSVTETIISEEASWVHTSANMTVNVSSFLAASNPLSAEVGTAFSTKFSQSVYAVGGTYTNGGAISAVAYSLRTPVAGLTMATDGTLSGTPTEAGTYQITVRTAVTYLNGSRNATANIDTTYTLTVAGEGGTVTPPPSTDPVQVRITGEGMIQITMDGGETWIDVIDKADLKGEDGAPGAAGEPGTTPTVEISSDGYWVINGTKTTVKAAGTDGKDGAPGAAGKDGKDGVDGKDGGGCGSSVETTSAAVAAAVVLAGLGVALIARKRTRKA